MVDRQALKAGWPDGADEHDMCLATRLCRRCGASWAAIARGQRAPYCEPGVTGISWTRAVERFRDSFPHGDQTVRLNGEPIGRLISLDLSWGGGGAPPQIGGFRFPNGSLDDGADEPPDPTAA